MRELRFKAVSLDTSKWIEGYGVCLNTKEDLANIFHKQGHNLMNATAVYPESICEYAGIGNIFEKAEIRNEKEKVVGYVEFDAGAFSLKITQSNTDEMDVGQSIPLFEFIEEELVLTGRNTYENPDVLIKRI
jgi:hypothetical protein